MNTHERLAPAFAVALAAGSGWLLLAASTAPERTATDSGQPQLYITRPVWDRFDAQGRLQRRLLAGRIEYSSDEEKVRLQQPRLVAWHNGRPALQVSARSGRLDESGRITLTGQVRGIHE